MNPILLVEDVEDNRELARMLLEAAGYAVMEAHNGLEALAQIERHQPSLVLLDLSLPIMDGWEVAGRLKGSPKTAFIPIVAFTAHAMAGDEARVNAAGFDGYIAKPINVNTFAAHVASFLPGGSAGALLR